MWNEFSVMHMICKEVCSRRNIPVVYSEAGVIPNTYAFEVGGQMGESYPAVNYTEFARLTVSADELDGAKKIVESLRESRDNRWAKYGVYKDEQLAEVQKRIVLGRPIVFYAGQNDYESGIIPYTHDSMKFHSPIFKSSYDAAVFLSEICKKRDWNFIYKRHPMMRMKKRLEPLPENVINYDELEIHDIIDFADVTVTILSQTSYVALIRKKPVVMLGFNQMRGKGCAYEAFTEKEVEKELEQAILNGLTKEQEDCFYIHVAQLIKYYLFEDFMSKTHSYGKSVTELQKELNKEFGFKLGK